MKTKGTNDIFYFKKSIVVKAIIGEHVFLNGFRRKDVFNDIGKALK